MKKAITLLILVFATSLNLLSQSNGFNSPVSQSANLSCSVIKQLSINPATTEDYIYWPTIPIGSKYTLGQSPNQDADNRSIFTFSGESDAAIQISVTAQTMVDNVELSYSLKGTQTPQYGGRRLLC